MATASRSIDPRDVVLEDFFDYLREPFVVLSGTPVSVISILTGIGIIVIARVIAKVLARSLVRLLVSRGADQGVQFSVAKIVRWSGTIVGIFVALTTIGINMNAALATMAVLLVGIGFGLQKLAENFLSGLLLLVERPLKVGDFISVEGQRGTVTDVGLRATRITTRDGYEIVIPNGDLLTKAVVNFTSSSSHLRIWVEIGVAYGTDLERASRVLLEVAAAEPTVLAEPAPVVFHTGFGDSSIDLALVCWIADAPEDVPIKSKLWFAIDRAFAQHGITIPFPQRDLHLKTVPPSIAISS